MAFYEDIVFQIYRLWRSCRIFLLSGGICALIGLGYFGSPGYRNMDWWWMTWALGALWVVTVSLKVKNLLTRRGPAPLKQIRDQMELGMLSVVGVYAGVQTAGGVLSYAYPVVFLMISMFVSFMPLFTAVFLIVFSLMLETSILLLTGDGTYVSLCLHSSVILAFACLNYLLTRLEVFRIRISGRRRLKEKLAQIDQDARDFRLVAVPSPSGGLELEKEEEETRLSQCTVSEVRRSLFGLLDIIRHAMQCHSCLLYWIDPGGDELRLKEAATVSDSISSEVFRTGEGLIGGVARQKTPVRLNKLKPGFKGLSYYSEPVRITALIAVPVMENEKIHGVLLADRIEGGDFSDSEQTLLFTATRQIMRTVENERVFAQLQRSKSDQGKLYRASESLNAARTEPEVLEAGFTAIEQLAPYDLAAVTDFNTGTGVHRVLMSRGTGADDLNNLTFKDSRSLVAMVVKNRHYLPYKGSYDSRQQVVFTKKIKMGDIESLLVIPLVVQDNAIGTLVIASRNKNVYHGGVRPILEVLSNQLAQSLASARMYRKLEELATIDGLTGLKNHRIFQMELDEKLKLAKRFDRPLSFLLIDVDHFKNVNDNHGHPAGDVVLKGVAGIIATNSREIDTAARYGGEEFAVVGPETDTVGAMRLAERIRKDVQDAKFTTDSGDLKVTVSVGVSTYPTHGEDKQAIIDQADQSLYRAKDGGRNRCEVAKAPLRRVS